MEINYRKKLEKHLKRKLKSTEIVHHIDGDSYNNKLKNLQICTHAEHLKLHRNKKEVNSQWKAKLNNFTKLVIDKQAPITDLLSLFFTEKQQQIIYLRLNKQRLSKTDSEYYSRTIKPKLKALAYAPLQRISEQLIWEII